MVAPGLDAGERLVSRDGGFWCLGVGLVVAGADQ
jgi:hypothetical protein